jgi:hypothetical protein
MANQWFRMYSEILHDSKVQILSEALRWRYVALLCLKSDGDFDNSPDDEIALSLKITEKEWLETKNELIKRRLLTSDGKIKGWEKRQYISDLKDPTAAERQKRYRDNKRNDRNDTVTSRLPEADTEQNRTDTDKKDSRAKAQDEIDGVFEQAWAEYPKRIGGNSKTDAQKAWKARRKEGVSVEEMLEGVIRYRKFCEVDGKIGTIYVKHASTFFGPGKHYAEDWELPKPKDNVTPFKQAPQEREEYKVINGQMHALVGDRYLKIAGQRQ